MLTLHAHQEATLAAVRQHIREGRRRVVIQGSTGSGKTCMAATMIGKAASRGRRSYFNVHRHELVKQASATFEFCGIPHGIISPAFAADRRHVIQVASIPTLSRRLADVLPPEVIIWDECHHLAAKSWSAIYARWPDAVHIGLTATPTRLDGQGLDEFFQAMVCGPTTADLIRDGFLAPYRLFAPPGVDVDGIHSRMGDFVPRELAAVVDRPKITGDALTHYQRYLLGKRAVAFCVSIEHSQHVAETFRAAGIPAAHVDGDTPRLLRDQCVASFERGDLLVLTNVDLFGEGFDLPAMEGVILLRPTQSLVLYLQQIGRGLRVSPGKREAIVLDHAGNSKRFGLPDQVREWTLTGRARGCKREVEATVAVKTCPECFAVVYSAVTVCACGHRFKPEGRKVAHVDGELQEVSAGEQPGLPIKAPVYTKDELRTIAQRRGYKRPNMWAQFMWNQQQARLLAAEAQA